MADDFASAKIIGGYPLKELLEICAKNEEGCAYGFSFDLLCGSKKYFSFECGLFNLEGYLTGKYPILFIETKK